VPGYELLGELGRGGMGVVYKARHLKLNRLVALKMILAGGHSDPDAAARFKAEGEAVARLQHPNIVQIFEVGEAPAGPYGPPTPYLAMEYVEGGTLHACLADRPQPPRDAARMAEVLARAVHYAHQRGVLHRDLKPGNILLSRASAGGGLRPPLAECVPHIADFGLAKRLDDSTGVTRSQMVVGTPNYMAPEQAVPAETAPAPLGPPADVYALGAILYEMLTGRPPFLGATPADTLLQVQLLDPLPPRRCQPNVPADLETVCLKCLQKEPAKRYPTAAELADDLARFLAGEPIHARPASPAEKAWKWAQRRPAVAGLAAALAVTALAGFASVLWQWRSAVAAWAEADWQARAEAEQRVAADEARHKAVAAWDEAESALYVSHVARARLEWQAGHALAAYEALEQCPPARRGWEWHYLDACRQGALWTFRHDSPVHRIAFTPDGAALAVASGVPSNFVGGGDPAKTPGAVHLWDLTTGRPRLGPLRRHAGSVREVGASPDGGRLLTVASDNTAVLWALPGGEVVAEFPVSRGAFAFAPDGRRFVVAGPREAVQVRDAATGTVVATWEPAPGVVERLDYSADGGQVLVAVRGREPSVPPAWQVRDAATGRLVRALTGVPAGILGPDREVLAAVRGDGSVEVWQLPPGWAGPGGTPVGEAAHILYRLRSTDGPLQAAAFSPDGLALATGGADTIVRVWDVATGAEQVAYRGTTTAVNGLAFSPDGRFLAAAGEYGGRVLVWDRSRHPEYDTLAHVGGAVEAAGFAGGGRRVLALARDGARLDTLDAATGLPLTRQALDFSGRFEAPARRAELSADGARLAGVAGSDPRLVHVWDTADAAAPRATLRGATASVHSVALAGNGRRVAATAMRRPLAAPGEVLVWDVGADAPLWHAAEPGLRPLAVALSADGARVAVAGWRFAVVGGKAGPGRAAVTVRDLGAGRATELTDPADEPPAGMPVSAEGRYTTDIPGSLAFSPDGRRVAVGSWCGRLRLWELTPDGSARLAWTAFLQRAPCDITFSPDGRRVATNTRAAVQVWDAASGLEMLALRGAPRAAGDPGFNPKVVFSPDGRRLLASHWDDTLSLHDATPVTAAGQPDRGRAAAGRGDVWHAAMLEAAGRRGLSAAAAFHGRRLAGRPLPPGGEPTAGDHLGHTGR
jgi:WD40 repeat protein